MSTVVLSATIIWAVPLHSFQQVTASRLSLYEAAAADVMLFGQALGQRGAPAGLILPEGVFASARRAVPLEQGAAQRPVADAVQRFNGSRTDLSARFVGKTLVVRSEDEPNDIKSAIDRRQPVPAVEGASAGDAILRHAAALPGLAASPSAVISTGPLPGPGCPIGKRVSVPGGEMSVVEFLNTVVEQAPGLVWLITYDVDRPADRLKIGYLCPDGIFRRVAVPGW